MPICVVSDPRTQPPAHLQRLPIPHLSLSSAAPHMSVKAKVRKKFPLVCPEGDCDYILKTVIQEYEDQQNPPSGFTSINTILFGPLAKDFSETVAEGDLLVLAGFAVGRSPTVKKDGLHPCNLQLAGGDVHVYVYPASTLGPSPNKVSSRTPAVNTEAAKAKYAYVALKDLKAGTIVNVYGVVTFFKQPFRTKGTDYCSTLKITDESDVKLGCSIFSEKLEDHPQIYKTGDIVRLHRVKMQLFNGAVNGMSTLGFSALTFDGTAGSPVTPRTSSRSFHFGDEDRQAVERLRAWAAGQADLPATSAVVLSAVQPRTYFDLTCQLLAKAQMDACCTLLKVWDGTMCADPLLNVSVEQDALEGSLAPTRGRHNLVANVLVYENHVEMARELKPGSYLCIYNLHAVAQSAETPPGGGGAGGAGHLSFQLHRGTAFGRGIRVLPDDSPDLQELKSRLESLENDPSDSSLIEWSTPPESLDMDPENSLTVRTCDHTQERVTLACVKSSTPPRVSHVRVRLRSYQPESLHQALKLHCPNCKVLLDVPDEEAIASRFREALSEAGCCSEPWAFTGHLDSCEPGRQISLHLCRSVEKGTSELVFVEGATFEEMCRMSGVQRSMVPVRSSEGRMTLLDLSAPFLFRGPKRYYGCTQCSQVKHVELDTQAEMEANEGTIAEVLGVQPLQYVFLVKMALEDDTDCLDALLWNDAESFFCVSASDAEASQEQQDCIQQTLDKLCPPGGSLESADRDGCLSPSTPEDHPWLDLCLRSYTVEESGQHMVCHQILNTAVRRTDV
ncbi:protection of telomeres protein 1 isoform X2 [Conger conger]|nr:protection of telomeres protein 1 isoform X2 [Conger conger]